MDNAAVRLNEDIVTPDEEAINPVIDLYAAESEEKTTPVINDRLFALTRQYGQNWVNEAIQQAAQNGKCNVAYVGGILANWTKSGKTDVVPIKPEDQLDPLKVTIPDEDIPF